MEPPSANQHVRTGKLRQLVSSVHRHVKTKSKSLLSSSETSTELKQSDLQRCIATVNSYSHHLGELRGLWEQHSHLLSSQPESKQRIDLIIQKSLADIEHCERILQRCSLVNLGDDGETRMWRKLRWELIDRHKFEHHKAQAERNDNTITTHIFALHHLILDRAVNKLLNEVRTPAANANGLGTENGQAREVNGSPPPANTGLTVPRLVVTRPGLPASPRPVRGASTPPPPRPVVSGKGKQAVEQRQQRPSSEPLRPTTAKPCCNHGECHVGEDVANLAVEQDQSTSPPPQPDIRMVMADATTISTTDFAAEPTARARAHGGGRRLAGPCCSKGENMGVDAGSTGIKLVH
ncbi:hypothetical protein QBC40DRAFT_202537 [Triangularia verruculosa]|uniref:Uncharacterized protein n=1 Tax=Triangularia verruculosa TaxID=2587418 RepID=A0AAN7AUA4_9PEZI|nr:hypothetical protein QBC40DRAFT_202537 [Triangularia verruculosa]